MSIRKKQAEQTKKHILDTAHRIVSAEGIHALSSTKIIEMAGISKGGFFHHFPQIEDLYLYMLDDLVQRLDENLAPQKFTSFREFIRSTTEFTIEFLDHSPESVTALFYFLSQSQHKLEYQKRLRAMLEGVFSRWADDIAHYFEPELSDAQKSRLVRILDMYFYGFSFHYLILGEKELYRNISDDFSDMLISFIRVTPEK